LEGGSEGGAGTGNSGGCFGMRGVLGTIKMLGLKKG